MWLALVAPLAAIAASRLSIAGGSRALDPALAGAAIRSARGARPLATVARDAGVPRSTLIGMEAGRGGPAGAWTAVARVLGLDLGELLSPGARAGLVMDEIEAAEVLSRAALAHPARVERALRVLAGGD